MQRIRYAVAAPLLVAASLSTLAAPAASAVPPSMRLTSSSDRVTFSSGKTLFIGVRGQQISAGATTLRVQLSTRNPHRSDLGESHAWLFQLSTASFTSPSAGSATLKTGRQQISPFGSMNLQFTGSPAKSLCSTESDYTGTLTGSIHFDTQTSTWGRFGRQSFSFDGPNLLQVWTDSCASPVQPPCAQGLGWLAAPFGGGDSTGTGLMWFNRIVGLKSPTGAVRSDHLEAAEPDPSVRNGILHVTTSGHTFTGRGAISNANKKAAVFSNCYVNSVLHTQKAVPWTDGDWSSPKSNRLTAAFAITHDGSAALSSANTASYYRYSWS